MMGFSVKPGDLCLINEAINVWAHEVATLFAGRVLCVTVPGTLAFVVSIAHQHSYAQVLVSPHGTMGWVNIAHLVRRKK